MSNYLQSFNISRRRKGEKIFLVAFYECNDDYEIENLEQDRLYCSKETWVGADFDEENTPKCLSVNDDGDNEDEDEEGAYCVGQRRRKRSLLFEIDFIGNLVGDAWKAAKNVFCGNFFNLNAECRTNWYEKFLELWTIDFCLQ